MWKKYNFENGFSTTGHSSNKQYHYVEQGGKPPLAIKFKDDELQVVCTGDARHFSDKYDEGTINKVDRKKLPESLYKTQTLTTAKKFPLSSFPLGVWVKFDVDVTWAIFNPGANGVDTNGGLTVDMEYTAKGASSKTTQTLVNKDSVMIGRNDALGYYFKFGCYRHSKEPFICFMKDYTQT